MSDLVSLWSNGTFALGVWETLYMTILSTAIAYVIGLPVGVLLFITDKGGVKQNAVINKIVGIVVNILRSIPFIILMVAFLPVAKFIVGTSMGNAAMVVMLVIAAAPYVARMVESSLKEVNAGVVEAARSMGASTFQIVTKVLLPEAKPSLVIGAVISTVTVLGYSAMAATIGGGGLGKIAITLGYQRFKDGIIWTAVILTVLIVQLIQELGNLIVKKIDKRLPKKARRKKRGSDESDAQTA